MNQAIANIIRNRIEDLSFIDKLAGLTSIATFEIKGKDNTVVQKTVPIACCVTADDCKEGAYNDLMPDSQYKSVIYFEDKGVTFDRSESNWKYYTSNLRLVCWLNIEKILGLTCKADNPCTYAARVIADIIRHLPGFPLNIFPFDRVYMEVTDQEVRNASIFSSYTYDEKHAQYLMAPYDYFALNIRTTFGICMKGVDVSDATCLPGSVTADSTLVTADSDLITVDAT